jgi:hypothetical protein
VRDRGFLAVFVRTDLLASVKAAFPE